MGITAFYIISIIYGVISSLGFLKQNLPSPFLFLFLGIIIIYCIYYAQVGRVTLIHSIVLALAVNAGVQLTGGSGSSLFPLYLAVLPVIAYKEHSSNYWIIALSLIAAETLSALFSHSVIPVPLIILAIAAVIFGSIARKHIENEEFLRKSLVKYESRDEFFGPASFDHRSIVTSVTSIDSHYGIERPLLFFIQLIHNIFDCHTTAIFSSSDTYLTLIQGFSHSDLFKKEAVLNAQAGMYRQVISAGKAVLIKEFVQNPEELGYYRGAVAVSSVMIAPVTVLDAVAGVLVADRAEGRFSDKEREKFEDAARTAGFLLAMLKLYEQKSMDAKYLRFIAEHVEALHKELGLKKILADAVSSFRSVMECNDVTIAAIDELRGTGEIVESTYIKKQTKFALDDGLVGLIARHKKFIIKEDMNRSGIVIFKKGMRTKNLSFIGVPVQLDEELLGVLWCEDHQTKKFTEESARAMNILASQLSFAWQRALHHEQEVEQAARDGLTELYNHRRFQEILAEELEKKRELVLLFFDIDHFKKINDTYGHQAGDEVLKFIGKLIRKTGIAARYGGEEFAIILPKYSLEKGIRLATQIKAQLKKSVIPFNDTQIRITVSIGVAHYPTDAKTRHELIEKADRAVYCGKETGRDKIIAAKTIRESEYRMARRAEDKKVREVEQQ
ncbi:hypothetical protein AMJ87_06675 [candidate division WOR_3 bacterium SM23_60]|uniref:GGDEF domain-containing protein n=1 Tax=candidate division WOR_3 bacterium SM23_60 TaxID=1703780 RepID=A0A0S8GJC8_UNCW3|nr:MAG: hypothetical protein AMJ87_06675 [candidate division WOR_3 bacterium SM23_60]